jgi:very-short-patch-repair endonuclease
MVLLGPPLMRGQTSEAILVPKLQRRLRNGLTEAEQKLWQRLRSRQLDCKFRRQHPYFNYILDFVCLECNLVVEVDGGQHADSTTDSTRGAFLRQGGFHVLRFWNNEVLTNIDDVVEMICRNLEERKQHHPHPNPPLEREGTSLRLASPGPQPLDGHGAK